MSHELEYIRYRQICRDKYPDSYKTVLGLTEYSNAEKASAQAEIAYYLEHGVLPDWAYVIESAETYPNGNTMFVYCDPTRKL
jgi:hypothetical protein